MNEIVAVSYHNDTCKAAAEAFAAQQQLPCVSRDNSDYPLLLIFTNDYLELRDRQRDMAVHVDFLAGDLAHRQQYGGGRGQAIAKAMGIKSGKPLPDIVDATAGLAKDAYVLATLGCRITLLEQSAVVAALVHDAIERAHDNEHFSSIVKHGFELIQCNSSEYLSQLAASDYPDVVYLDPMFPERKKSAAVKKNMQLLQTLLGKEQDMSGLFAIALQTARKRVVVKRPKSAPPLAGKEPHYTVSGKTTRYDIYLSS